ILAYGISIAGQNPTDPPSKTISEAECTTDRIGTSIPVDAIGEPVAGVTLNPPRWTPAGNAPASCTVDGAMTPMDKSAHGREINFRVVLPASWSRRAVQIGGGGMDGNVPNLTGGEAGTLLRQGFATYGSDSGHQLQGSPDWTLSDEAIKNI